MTTKQTNPAEAFPPGDFIREELDARGWAASDLAERMGQTESEVSALIAGTQPMTPELAEQLGAAFGTSTELWLNLEASCRKSNVRSGDRGIMVDDHRGGHVD